MSKTLLLGSVIGILAFAAILSSSNVNAATVETLQMINDHCLANVDTILAGGNPVQDLIDAGLIPSLSITDVSGKTCDQIQADLAILEFRIDAMESTKDLARLPD